MQSCALLYGTYPEYGELIKTGKTVRESGMQYFCLNLESARLQQQSGLSASDSKNSLPPGCYGPLIPPVLDLLEDAAGASPLLSFIGLYFLHL